MKSPLICLKFESNPNTLNCSQCGFSLRDHLEHRCYIDEPCELCGKPGESAAREKL